ncbi:MAG: hypothetical protein ACI4MO_04210 [Christensenellales bacterium]
MKKTAVAILMCLIVVLTIGLAGCSQGVDKLFGKQEKVSYSLQEVTEIEMGSEAIMQDCDTFGMAIFRYYSTLESETYYSLYNFEKNSMIVNNSKLQIIKISQGLYAQINAEGKYILYGVDGLIESGLEGTIIGESFYDKNSGTTYYIGINGKLKTTKSPFAEIITYEDVYTLGDYKIRAVGSASSYGFEFFNQKGESVGKFFAKTDFNLSSNATLNQMWIVDNKIFAQYTVLSYTSKDKFDLYEGGEKYNVITYCYDIKSGKSKETKFEYVVKDVVEMSDDSVILKVANISEKSTTAEYVQAFGVDAVGNLTVKVDLQKLLKGATGVSVRKGADGKSQLILKNDAETCLFEGKDCLVKFNNATNATISQDTVKVNNKIYTLGGKLIIDISEVISYNYTDDGKLTYSMKDKDDPSKTRYYIYDIVKDSTREITTGFGESVVFNSQYYKVGNKLYFYTLESQKIDNVQNISYVDSYGISDTSYKQIFRVAKTDGSVKYYVYAQSTK